MTTLSCILTSRWSYFEKGETIAGRFVIAKRFDNSGHIDRTSRVRLQTGDGARPVDCRDGSRNGTLRWRYRNTIVGCFHRIDTEIGPITPSISDADWKIRPPNSMNERRFHSIAAVSVVQKDRTILEPGPFSSRWRPYVCSGEGMISFDAEHGAVHYPPDRRFRVWISPSIVLGVCGVIVSLIAAAWVEMAFVGLPHIPPVPQVYPNNFLGPHGFPLWVRYCHFFNFLFVMMLIRSGLSILGDHPRLYFNDDCTPGSEWIRLTPLKVPRDRIWTAKDDARYISPLGACPRIAK